MFLEGMLMYGFLGDFDSNDVKSMLFNFSLMKKYFYKQRVTIQIFRITNKIQVPMHLKEMQTIILQSA